MLSLPFNKMRSSRPSGLYLSGWCRSNQLRDGVRGWGGCIAGRDGTLLASILGNCSLCNFRDSLNISFGRFIISCRVISLFWRLRLEMFQKRIRTSWLQCWRHLFFSCTWRIWLAREVRRGQSNPCGTNFSWWDPAGICCNFIRNRSVVSK